MTRRSIFRTALAFLVGKKGLEAKPVFVSQVKAVSRKMIGDAAWNGTSHIAGFDPLLQTIRLSRLASGMDKKK